MWEYARYEGGYRKAFNATDHWKDKEDGITYYRLECMYWFGDWIETQGESMWKMYGAPHRGIYIVTEQLMTLIRLKWL